MAITVETGATLPFERFWRWLKLHANCILRAGTPDADLHDQEAFHWHLEEDDDRNPVVQLVWGKLLVGEMVLALGDVLDVEATPDPGATEPGPFRFEVVAGPKEDPRVAYSFLVAHGFDEDGHRAALPH